MSSTTCQSCGAETAAQAIYCHQCGARIAQFDEEGFYPPPADDPLATSSTPPAGNPTSREEDLPDRSDPGSRAGLLGSRAGRTDDGEEEFLWKGTYSPKAMYPVWAVCALATVAALLVAAVYLRNGTGWLILLAVILLIWLACVLRLFYQRLGVRYSLTSKRFRHELGILRRTTDRMEVIDIDDVSYQQGIIDRLTDVGTIKITSSDRSHPEIVLRGIEGVKDVADQFDSARRKERERRGLHIEAI